MKLLIGAFMTMAIALGSACFILATGRFNVAGTTPPGLIETLAPKVRDRSIRRHAEVNPALRADPAAAGRGLTHYRENCLPCHGAPGVRGAEFQQGMNPAPPAIESRDVQKYTDAELFWIVKNGIRMSGMPAFSVNHDDVEILDIVAFVRHAPQLLPVEREALAAPGARANHHHQPEAKDEAGPEHHGDTEHQTTPHTHASPSASPAPPI